MTPLKIILVHLSDPFRIGLISGAVLLGIWVRSKHIPPILVILLLVLVDIGLAFLIPATMAPFPSGPVPFWRRVI